MKKKTNLLVYIGIGCLVLLVLAGIGTAVAIKFFANKVSTGVKSNLQDLQDGKMTFTDPETGSSVNIGTGEVPENFPTDMPLYPGAKVTSSLSGGENEAQNGFWLTLSTPDSLETVASYYKTSLAASGWTTTANYSANGTSTQAISNEKMSGTISLTQEEAQDTQIVIVLGEESSQ